MENKQYQPFGPEWEKEISQLTIPELIRFFGCRRKSTETKPEFIKRMGKIKLEEYAEKRGFYILSLIRTRRHEEFVVLWANEGKCTYFKEEASIYLDPQKGYHDSDDNIAIKISFAKSLFVERMIEGKLRSVIPNVKSSWDKLGVKMDTLHLEKI